jgi:hypothetical protein
MDWSNVTPGELWDALREVRGSFAGVAALLCHCLTKTHSLSLSPLDQTHTPRPLDHRRSPPTLHQVELQAPRPLWEFCTKFSIPKNQAKWSSRAKCNAYYYRSNYLAILGLALLGALLRTPRALLGGALGLLALLCLNDPFAAAFK